MSLDQHHSPVTDVPVLAGSPTDDLPTADPGADRFVTPAPPLLPPAGSVKDPVAEGRPRLTCDFRAASSARRLGRTGRDTIVPWKEIQKEELLHLGERAPYPHPHPPTNSVRAWRPQSMGCSPRPRRGRLPRLLSHCLPRLLLPLRCRGRPVGQPHRPDGYGRT